MKSFYLLLLVVFLLLHFGFACRGENQTRYQLSVNGMLPKVGEETEKTWDVIRLPLPPLPAEIAGNPSPR